MKGRMPGLGLPSAAPGKDKDHYHQQLAAARNSDASKGKFSKDLKKEQPLKNSGKRRKFEGNTTNIRSERERAMDIVRKINSKKDILGVARQTNIESAQDGSKKSKKKMKGKAKVEGKKNKAGSSAKGRRSKAGGKSRK